MNTPDAVLCGPLRTALGACNGPLTTSMAEAIVSVGDVSSRNHLLRAHLDPMEDAVVPGRLPDRQPRRTGLALAIELGRVGIGDARAFERVYAATSAKLYGIIVRILGRRDVADDVLQDVYVRVWQRATEFDPSLGSPITWLASIARNLALDVVRRKPSRSLLDCPETLEVPSRDDPFADLERADDRRRLWAALKRLDSEKRAIVVMAYHYGMTRDEIALQTGRPVATIKTWLRRSLIELKRLLSE